MVEENDNVLRRPPAKVRKKTKCFVCDMITSDGAVWLMELLSVNANLLENIGGLMGDGAFVIVSWDDVVCITCSLLLKYFTKLERDLVILKNVLRYYFKVKYHLKDEKLDRSATINRQDIDYITECAAQVFSAADKKGSQLSEGPQTLNPIVSQNYYDKTETVPQESMTRVSNSDNVSGLNQKETNTLEKDKLETYSRAAQKRYHSDNHTSTEQCKDNEAQQKEIEPIVDADICLSPAGKIECLLNLEDFHSKNKQQKYFMSHTMKSRNDVTNSPYHREVCNLLFKEGTLREKYPSGKNVSTIPVEKSNGKMNNVISITLNSDGEQEFEEDPCSQSSSSDHMVQLPFMKSSVLAKNAYTEPNQENKQVSETLKKTEAFEVHKNVIHGSISSEKIIISDKTKQKKSDFNSLSKHIDYIILNNEYVIRSNSVPNTSTNSTQKELPKCTDKTKQKKSDFNILSKHIENIILNNENVIRSNSVPNTSTNATENSTQKELPKCTETKSNSVAAVCTKTMEKLSEKEKPKYIVSTVGTLPQSAAVNEKPSKSTVGLESSNQITYLSSTNSRRPEKVTYESPSSENLMKIVEDNQIIIHSTQNEWIGSLEIGLDDDMPNIVLGDEMVVDGSTIEEIAFEETQVISTGLDENSYSDQLETAENNISKQENLSALCPADTNSSKSTNIAENNRADKVMDNKTSQLVLNSNSRGNHSAPPGTSCVSNERTILRSCDVENQKSLLGPENVSDISPHEKIFKCHICNRILTTQSNLKRHLLKHEKCSVGSVTCELCDEQLVDVVHLKQHLKVQHQQCVKCAFCNKEFSNMKLCRDHELTHPERATYKCDICNQMFVTEGRLKNHKESVHNDLCDTFRENEFFKCHICFKTLRTLHNLKRHLTAHEKSPVPVSCNLCQEVFAEKSQLYQHREEKHPRKHNCSFCNKEFENLKSCRIHESLHPERVVYKCNICETVFLTESRLNRHKEIYHREPYCRICGKEITDRSKLIEHEKRHGKFQQVFMCKECPKVFRTASGLKYHMSVHTGKYSVYCEICGKGLHSEVVLAEHKATHTKEVRYTCELCGRTFSSNSTYRMHRLWHDNPLPYQCNFCEKKFKHTSILAVHKRRVHTGERPYKCKYCNMAFSVSSTRNKHLIVHTKQYPYKCEQCNKGFTTRTKIANHLSKVHSDDSMLAAGKKVCEYKMALRPSEMALVEPLHEFPADEIEEIVL